MYLPIVVINVIEYKKADAYDHLCGFIDGCAPVCWIFVALTARNNISCKEKNKKPKTPIKMKTIDMKRVKEMRNKKNKFVNK